jgi:F-type H+-transporting ATPase subunit delta
MSSLIVVERYITTLFNIAQENGLTESIKDDLNKLDQTFQDSFDLKFFYESRSIPAGEKKKLLLKIMTGLELNEYTKNYFLLILDNRRFKYEVPHLSFVTFNNFYKKSLGIKQGIIILSKKISNEEQAILTQQLGDKLKCKLELEFQYDPSLIDGSYLEIDGMVYEDNLKMRLANLKNWMKV